MKAGRELDALIAEKVMGLCGHYLIRDVRKGDDPFDDYITWTCEKCDKEFRGLSYGAGYKNPNLKNYSTQIADAWPILGKFEEYYLYKDQHRVLCKVAVSNDDAWSIAIADTAPLAICLAALKAVKGDANE